MINKYKSINMFRKNGPPLNNGKKLYLHNNLYLHDDDHNFGLICCLLCILIIGCVLQLFVWHSNNLK
jgi:hypothetical protein